MDGTSGIGVIDGGRRVKKSVKRSASPKRKASPKPVMRTKRASSPKGRKSRTGGYEEQANMENEMLEAVGGGTCGIGGARKPVHKPRRPRSASPAKKRRPRKTRKGGSEEEQEEFEQQQEGGGRKMKHKRMCARKLSPYNLFVKKRMCEMRKQTKSPVVMLMKQIAAEWKAKK